jgi:hypothetical protein
MIHDPPTACLAHVDWGGIANSTVSSVLARVGFTSLPISPRRPFRYVASARVRRVSARSGFFVSLPNEVIAMAKGQQKPKTNNKPKLTAKERKQKKKEKVKTRTA